ncbi:MAG: hypothetical protein IJW49_00420 [Clostridia bacterium]|nr:hypothetical protein [Clostridia bacterium]
MREKIQKIREFFLADKPAAANQLANQILNSSFPRIGTYESAKKLQMRILLSKRLAKKRLVWYTDKD